MDWIVFGDDWSAHPSTTQHLVRNMPEGDRVVWIDSIGMRQPRLDMADLQRLLGKARALLEGGDDEAQGSEATAGSAARPMAARFERIKPKVVPFHLNPLIRRFNAMSLGQEIRQRLCRLGASDRPTVLSSVPVAALYLDAIPHDQLAYLRLDDYGRLPGCDRELVERTERAMFERADLIFGTARALLPEAWADKGRYLPQGVDCDHFGRASVEPSGERVLGFFGLLAEWIDFELIEAVARAAPDWQLEFVGPVRHLPERMREIDNLRFLPPVPFAELPEALSAWTAAWIPFEVSELTEAVNPLKAREYLAAGIASCCTPLPEVRELSGVFIAERAEPIVAWLEEVFAGDSREARLGRREGMERESWASRYAQLREQILASSQR